MEPKKISFGFMKTKKAEKPVDEDKRDYIECLEEKAIKVVGGETIQEEKPLVIPMKPNTLITAERLKEIAEKVEKDIAEVPQAQIKTEPEEKPMENETLDQMAVRELLQDAKKQVKEERPELTVPLPAAPVIEGEKEPTLEDYDSVPVQDFGMAMLRGMGWTPDKDGSKYKLPELRPKGLGLGADKVVKENQKKNANKNKDEELAVVKNAFVKITTGKYSGCYGKVLSLDEDNGRVTVDVPIKKETVSLSEFMLQPVSKAEFDKESRVINQDTYEEYKKNEKSQKSSSRHQSPNMNRTEASSSHGSNKDDKKEKRDERHRDRRRRDKSKGDDKANGRSKDRKNAKSSSCDEPRGNKRDSSSEDRSSRRKKEKKKYRSSESLDSLSDSDKKRNEKSSKKYTSEEESDDYKKNRHRNRTEDGKRDIDKKRKGKKKKRDRDRSPNHKKHRK